MKKDTSVNVRSTSELRSRLPHLAEADGRTLSNYIERVLNAHTEAKLPSEKPPEPAKRHRRP